jgi:hypothetical protein
MNTSHPDTRKRGIDVLHDPSLNKSTAFTNPSGRRWGWWGSCPM